MQMGYAYRRGSGSRPGSRGRGRLVRCVYCVPSIGTIVCTAQPNMHSLGPGLELIDSILPRLRAASGQAKEARGPDRTSTSTRLPVLRTSCEQCKRGAMHAVYTHGVHAQGTWWVYGASCMLHAPL